MFLTWETDRSESQRKSEAWSRSKGGLARIA